MKNMLKNIILTIQTNGQTRKAKNSRINQVFGQVKLPIQTSVRYLGKTKIDLISGFDLNCLVHFSY